VQSIDNIKNELLRMKYKAISTDIDGTLLDSRRQLSAKTIKVFNQLKDVPVILASSRMPAAMRHLQAELGVLNHPLVCYNGGYVIRYQSAQSEPEVLETIAIPVDVCKGIIGLSAGTSIHTSLYRDDEWHAPAFDVWTEREARITKVEANVTDLNVITEQWSRNSLGAHKVMCMGPEPEIHSLEQKLNDQFGTDIHIYRSRPTYLELAPRAISKATGLALILKRYYDIKMEEVIAFGDNYNDIEMLHQAGWGVAVANARDEVKAVSNEIAGDSKQDGVADVIEKYFLS
jgi:Cof subfamily protein (haloacid dehalogenase superfamily)